MSKVKKVSVVVKILWCGKNVKRRIVYMPNPKYDVNVPDNELPVTADKISFICNKSEPISEVTIKPDMRENEITGCDNCRFRIR